jgi:hypothetical protein
MGFLIWAVSTLYWFFSPASSLGKKAIFLSWIYGPCNLAYSLLFKTSVFNALGDFDLLPTIAAIFLAYKFGERIVDKMNPNAGRLMYILIGIGSSIALPIIVRTLFN